MALQAFRLMLGFGLSIPVFFATTNAWVLWFLIPLLVESLRRSRRRRERTRGAGDSPDDGK